MLPGHKIISLIFLQLTSMLFLCSCGVSLQTISPKELWVPATGIRDKIPLHAGLYFRKRFLNFTYPLYMYKIDFLMGEALSGGTEDMLKDIFEKVTIISPTDTEIEFSKKNIEVIVTPTLIGMSDNSLTRRSTRPLRVQTIIQWNIVSPDGKDIYFIKIIGEGSRKIVVGSRASLKEQCKGAYIASLVNQFNKAQEDIYSSGWWKNQWWKQGK